MGVALGLVVSFALTRPIRAKAERSYSALRVAGFAIAFTPLLRGYVPDPSLLGIVGGLVAL